MKVLFTATGSIGSRHITNFSELCKSRGLALEIDAIRYSDRVLPEAIAQKIRREIRSEADLDSHYDILFVTDETKTHYDNIMKYRNICDSMFIEKPIFDTLDYPIETIRPKREEDVYYVACPIRFTKYVKKLKACVDSHRVYSARIIFSSYMPSWQPGRDYRKSFRCFNDRGGGVDVDLLHEIDYMIYLFGKPQKVHRVAGKFSHLEMDACDLATYIFEYGDKVVEMHLDYFGRVRNRQTELYAEDDVVVVDFNKQSCELKAKEEVEHYGADDHFYQDEMAYFLDLYLSKGKMENINTPKMAYETLSITKGLI